MDYRDVLATVVGASIAGIVAFFIRLVFPVNAAVLALIYAATYSLLWSLVGGEAQRLFKQHLPANTRLDGHWRLVSGGIALCAALGAGLIVAFAVSRSSFSGDSATTPSATLVTRTLALQQRVVVTKKTIVLPVRTMVVTAPASSVTTTLPGTTIATPGTSTVYSRTVVVERPAVTVTVASTRSQTVTQTTPTVTAPAVTLPPEVTTVVTTEPVTIATEPAATDPPVTTGP